MFLFELGKKFVVCYGHYLCVHAKCNFAIDKKKTHFGLFLLGADSVLRRRILYTEYRKDFY